MAFILKNDLTGQKFGKLTVIKRGPNDKKRNSRWYCKCDCGNPNLKLVRSMSLKNGDIKSCGCTKTRQNLIDMDSNTYAIGYTSKGEPFWFDKEDIDIVKKYCWHYNNSGYLVYRGGNPKVNIMLHRLIMGVTDPNVVVDHIIHPTGKKQKIDNRKQNLRVVSQSQNLMNRDIDKRNKTSIKGVCYDNERKKWLAFLTINKKRILFKRFETFEEAVAARQNAEIKFCKEYIFIKEEENL